MLGGGTPGEDLKERARAELKNMINARGEPYGYVEEEEEELAPTDTQEIPETAVTAEQPADAEQ